MQNKKLRRLLAGASTVAVTAGFAASFGVGAAWAAPVSQSTTAGQWTLLRTVQGTIPDADTTTTLTAPATATNGAPVDLVATVSPAPDGGTVQFFDGGTPIGAPVDAIGGTATLSQAFATAGSHSITASFSGAPGFVASAAPAANVEVSDPAPVDVATTTTLSVPATADTGASVNLTATVSPAPTGGTVQFFDGATPLGAPIDAIGGTATLSQAFATAGSHSITASFSGAPGFVASSAPAATVAVTVSAPLDVATTTTLSVPATADTGASVNLTATVSPAPTGGTVQFFDGAKPLGAPVDVTGGTATLSQAFATAGSHSITAKFSGAPGFVASSAPAARIAVTVPLSSYVVTTTTLTAPETVRPAEGVTLSVVVNPAPNGNGGTVQFFDGTDAIGAAVPVTNGRASITYYNLTGGPHSVTAKYSGSTSGYFGSTSEAKVVTVTSSGTPPTYGSS
ncbi:Ig-like domain-containing protein [Aldersonia sp. NBC_00410]|uniref:Ig-like domain-containing protein n=1 Tax=Aldersonia sp. NBC_00410 TaxID=2975954 RepID=UPI00224EA15C|nr:Ig-like domain-containing protein [Aldersonia sp. NBC_00410]MCX5041895.1 Ig-like domain-containing protein [Aldersonia sp. NBC_00410]